jgi:hypothetical protein
MMYAICLSSKYTGDEIVLGTKHVTREAAHEFAREYVCLRCNRYSVFPIEDDAQWINKHIGFRVANKRASTTKQFAEAAE